MAALCDEVLKKNATYRDEDDVLFGESTPTKAESRSTFGGVEP